ncbi:UNVERIFIED_CONTAM: hypothetical protein NCL1_18164 [Trichonephila clavipes]
MYEIKEVVSHVSKKNFVSTMAKISEKKQTAIWLKVNMELFKAVDLKQKTKTEICKDFEMIYCRGWKLFWLDCQTVEEEDAGRPNGFKTIVINRLPFTSSVLPRIVSSILSSFSIL